MFNIKFKTTTIKYYSFCFYFTIIYSTQLNSKTKWDLNLSFAASEKASKRALTLLAQASIRAFTE